MKVLFIRSGCACRLPFAESFFRKKLQEAEMASVEVESADMALWSVKSNDAPVEMTAATDGKGDLLSKADLVVVMEEKQRNLLSRFMDYACWNKIHLLTEFCRGRNVERTDCFVDYSRQTPNEEMNDGCMGLIEHIRSFVKEHLMEKDSPHPATAL